MYFTDSQLQPYEFIMTGKKNVGRNFLYLNELRKDSVSCEYKPLDFDCQYCTHRKENSTNFCPFMLCVEVMEAYKNGDICHSVVKPLVFAEVMASYKRSTWGFRKRSLSVYLAERNKEFHFMTE